MMRAAALALLLSGCSSTPLIVVPPPVTHVHVGPAVASGTTCSFGDEVRCAAACAHEDGASCTNLGAMYELGEGVQRDGARARAFYFTACAHGAKGGCINLSRMDQEAESSVRAAAASPARPPAPDLRPALPVAADPPPPEPPPRCADTADCKAKCRGGDAVACDQLPGIHISGNVHIHGNVTMFGDVYMNGQGGRAPPPKP